MLLVAGAIAAVVLSRGGKPGQGEAHPRAEEKAAPAPKSEPAPRDRRPEPPPVTAGESELKGAAPVPAVVEVAPAPRRVGHHLPPSTWSSDWQQVGNVRARVYSVALERVALVADRNRVSESPGPALAVWVEVENLAAVPKRLRWWQDALADYAELKTARGVPIGRARFGAGVRVRDMPEQTRTLGPGDPPVAALVVFDPPPADAGVLTLRLDAAQVDEAGSFVFKIPAGVWK
jgi:hypothetical protein